jgi:DNA-directed RNA polymerase specialized sigma24 family protein
MRAQLTMGRASDASVSIASPEDMASRSTAIESALLRFGEFARRAGAAHGLSGTDLDEVLQDVRIRIWKASSALSKIETLSPSYVYRAAASAAVDMLRRRRARREQSMTQPLALDQERCVPTPE